MRVIVGVEDADVVRGLVLDDEGTEVVKLRVESMSGHEESSVIDWFEGDLVSG